MNWIIGVKKPHQAFPTLKLKTIRGLKKFQKVLGVTEPSVSSGGSEPPVSSGGSRTAGK